MVNSNTNLGMVLLLAPLSKAAGADLRARVRDVLDQSTVSDAIQVYEAIRIASPGGLGEVKNQDVRDAPTASLRDVMALAADRDLIARQYANGFADVFDLGVPALVEGVRRFGRLEPAIQHCQLAWLASHSDSLIVRKRGPELAAEASRRARSVIERGGVGDAGGPGRLRRLRPLAPRRRQCPQSGHDRRPDRGVLVRCNTRA